MALPCHLRLKVARIEPSCVTENGTCSVKWNSQNTRPEGHVLQHNTDDEYNWSNSPDVIHLPETFNTSDKNMVVEPLF